MKVLFLCTFLFLGTLSEAQVFSTIDGHIHFISNAPLEIIEASSTQMQGAIDLEKKTFAFKMYIKSFEGFNNSLQKVHFYENYMEVDQFPIATFAGKILEPFEEGKNTYRAKGELSIHGVTKERIIDVEMNISKDRIRYNAQFSVPLDDHEIHMPRIVYQKIAEVIEVDVDGTMMKR